jgi:hypothetical protein
MATVTARTLEPADELLRELPRGQHHACGNPTPRTIAAPTARDARMNLERIAPVLRISSPFPWSALAGAAAYIIWKRLEQIDGEQVWAQIQSRTPRAIALAGLSCVLSYALVGIYEGLAA